MYQNVNPYARAFTLVMGILICVSVLTLVLEPLLHPTPQSDAEAFVWFVVEAVFTILFTVEICARFIVVALKEGLAGNKQGKTGALAWIKRPLNIVDIIAVLPWYIDVITAGALDNPEFRLLRIIRLMRLARLVRLGRLAKSSALVSPIAMILVVIWGIYMKAGLGSSC